MKARREILLICFIYALFFPLNATFGQFGIKGGIVLSGYQPSQSLQIEGDHDYRPFLGYEVEFFQDDEGSPDIGFQLGVFYNQEISKHFAVQPEIYYSQRGINFYKTELYSSSYNLNIHYLEIPILLKYKIPLEWSAVPVLRAGPYLALMLSAKRTLVLEEKSSTESVNALKTFDYGIIAGVAFEFLDFPASPLLELRFNLGLANTMQQPREYTSLYKDPGTVKLYALSFLVGVKL